MKLTHWTKVLGIYDLFIAVVLLSTGLMMIRANQGIFLEYPTSWREALPFDSWTIPGFIVVIYGMGNFVAAISAMIGVQWKPWLASGIMGSILVIALILQRMVLGETYLAAVQFLTLGIIQLVISVYIYRRETRRTT